MPRTVDVFVSFSVAGGAGAGIFYDYLHFIGLAFTNSRLQARIWPLVVMPSAFDEGYGGNRAARLNAGRALVDLFHLVDQQNTYDSERLYRTHDQHVISTEEAGVSYPVNGRIVMPPGMVQTAFLFSRPEGVTQEDLRRSIVSLVMSLIGTEMTNADQRSGIVNQSFADSFVNQAALRIAPAENGIGKRGVSTALAASLTVPADDLADIISSRILREAIEYLATPVGRTESTRVDMVDFLIRAGAQPILDRAATAPPEPRVPSGARAVTAALADRQEAMRMATQTLRAQLGNDIPQMVTRFDPAGAVRALIASMDIFRLQRIVFGHPDLADEVERGGVFGLLHRRRMAPPAVTQPTMPEFRDRVFRKVQWSDPEPTAYRDRQDAWYAWATQVEWAKAWDTHTPSWRRPLEQVERDLRELTAALLTFARHDREDFMRRSADLYRTRIAVSYLVPNGISYGDPAAAPEMEQFYQQVYRRLVAQGHATGQLNANPTPDEVLATLVPPESWREIYRISVEQGPEHAVSYLRGRAKTGIKIFLRESRAGESPMLPRLADLLVQAAGQSHYFEIQQEYLEAFRRSLTGFLPTSFVPQGNGPLKVLISYPADAPNRMVEAYLENSINLPSGPLVTYEYRATAAESISVVMYRTSMGITEVREVRDVLRLWADALDQPIATDKLAWRQRTGYNFGYVAMREEDRVAILHRLLSALWNGRGSVTGRIESPDQLSIEFSGITMSLPLRPFGSASSWGSILRAYEQWALGDDEFHRQFCASLMRELPSGLNSRPQPPHELYSVIRKIAEEQIELLNDIIKRQPTGRPSRARLMRDFWLMTLPAALDAEFELAEYPVAASLRELETIAADGTFG